MADKQHAVWQGDVGKGHTDRAARTIEESEARYKRMLGISRLAMNREFVGEMERSIRVLEIGSGHGSQLAYLHGFESLCGVELREDATRSAKSSTRDIVYVLLSRT